MAKTPKLKVYRTPIGFHDAYVAAPSQKAALKAWGTDKNLFARGDAEIVTGEALVAEPLSHPGMIIKRPRGTSAEHMASLPKDEKPSIRRVRGSAASQAPTPKSAKSPPSKPKPRPSRADLDRAEKALAEAETAHRVTEDACDQEIAKLSERREALRARNAARGKSLAITYLTNPRWLSKTDGKEQCRYVRSLSAPLSRRSRSLRVPREHDLVERHGLSAVRCRQRPHL